MTNRPVQAFAADKYDEARANRHKKKSPAASGEISTESHYERNESVKSTLPQFNTSFEIATKHASISVDAAHGNDEAIVCLDIDGMHSPLSPAEALSVAAALQAVAVHQMESRPREIRRKTEPGAPSFEESV